MERSVVLKLFEARLRFIKARNLFTFFYWHARYSHSDLSEISKEAET